jgi:MFS family permease
MSGTLDISGSPSAGASTGLLAREHTIAAPGFDRWLVPPAALCIHLCIGMAYGFSVFWLPLSRAIGIDKAVACPAGTTWIGELTTTSCDWSVSMLSMTFTLFIVVLGLSAALWGGWLERVGPRKAGFVAAICWAGGFLLGALGIYVHQLWLIWLGTGILGGIGLGIGYISPVSTLIKWFPDRRGMATGMAIMGFGGGAMIGSPLADLLMRHFATPQSVGVWQAFFAMGSIYLVVMMIGAFGYRLPPPGWAPRGWTAPAANASTAMITRGHVHLEQAWKTPQFWLIWGVLCLNVTAGIGVISMASPMLQDVFGGGLLGVHASTELSTEQKAAIAAAAAGLVGLISLFNSLGRLGWASASDYLGRKLTYIVFFVLGIVLYCLLPTLGHMGMAAAFVITVCVIISMYGGGFATVPAYLADIFGTQMVGAIHGRLLTAWSVAGIVGPVLIAGVREAQLNAGVQKTLVYDRTLYILAGLLLVGLVCNLLVRPVDPKYHMTEEELARERSLQRESSTSAADVAAVARGPFGMVGVLAWLAVGIPFLVGVWIALQKAAALL